MFKPTVKISAYIVCLVFTVATILLALQARNFEINASADTLLVDDNKHYILSQLADQRYGSEEFILITYQPKSDSVFDEKTLTTIAEISEKITKIKRVKNVNSIINVPIFTAAESFDADVSSLTWQEKKFAQKTLLLSLKNHPLYEDLLINKAQTALSMQVVFKESIELTNVNNKIINIKKHLLKRELTAAEQKELTQLKLQSSVINKTLETERIEEIEAIRNLLKPYQNNGDFYLGGNNLLSYELIKIIENDLVLFGSAILALVVILLAYLFRQLSWVLLPIVCCAISVIITVGLLTALAFKVTVISANVFALQIILSLAMIIHLIVHYQELVLKHQDWTHTKLVLETIKQKINPCFYAGLTTAIGFGSLIFSGVQPVISFGWMMVVAMLVSFLVSLVFFPALLITFFGKQTHVAKHKLVEKSMTWCATTAAHKPKRIIALSSLLTVIGLVGCLLLTAENSFLNYFDKSTDVRKELSFIDQQFGGSTSFDLLYDIPADEIKTDLIISAAAVQTITDIQNMLAEQTAIGSITSLADFTKIAQVVNGKPLTEYELTALYKSLDPALQQSLFGAYFSEQDKQVRISMRVQDSTENLNRADLLANIHQELANLGIEKTQYTLTGLFILYEDVLSHLVDSQILTLMIVYSAMAITLMIIFSSFKVAIIALVPNFITTAIIMGVMGLFAIPLDLMTITIAAVAMGISMDDTIHYVHRYLDELKQNAGGDKADYVLKTNVSVGYALIYTTTIIVVGFGSLIFSNFVPSMLFGLLTSIAMVVALLTDITTLPVMLKKYIKHA
ncbi:MAG: efflux RND transporter permease subunit [Thalassotalea sp.]